MPLSASLMARVALEKHGFRFSHTLGQNFLLDDEFIDDILRLADVRAGMNILEIGPGAGVMTAMMADRGARVLALEIDRALEGVLQDVLAGRENVQIVFADAMKENLDALRTAYFGDAPYAVVANLPYYITTDMVLKVLATQRLPETITIMVQKEAAERMMAQPGDKQYCALAATVRYYAVPEILLEVPPEHFTPPPHVTSCLMRIRPHAKRPVQVQDEALFLRVITALFAMRRKTLVNNLTHAFSLPRETAQAIVTGCGLDARVRGEAIPLTDAARIADALAAVINRR